MIRRAETASAVISVVVVAMIVIVGWSSTFSTVVAQDIGRLTTIQIPEDHRRSAVVARDVDGDGRRDLVIAVGRTDERRERHLRVHLRRASGATFVQTPDYETKLQRDVVAFGIADVHADSGAEIVLFGPRVVAMWRPKASERDRFAKLLGCRFLWHVARREAVYAWQTGLVDVDGDGLTDILVPEPNGYRLARQVRDGKNGRRFDVTEIAVPFVSRAGDDGNSGRPASRRNVRVSIPFERPDVLPGSSKPPLVDLTDTTPYPSLLDFDGDGDVDILGRTSHHVLVWSQTAPGKFSPAPTHTFDAPVVTDRRRALDFAYGTHFLDLDTNRRADAVVLASDLRSDDPRTQILVFVNGKSRGATKELPLFGPEGLPRQLMVIVGFAGSPRFDDVDGDGRPDLVVGSVRPELIDDIGTKDDDRIPSEFYVFRNAGDQFERPPMITFRRRIEAGSLRSSGRKLVVRFFADLTGDGVKELVVRDKAERLRFHLVRKGRKGVQVLDDPLWELKIDEDAEVEVVDNGPPALLLLESNQVTEVSFER